MTSGPRVPDRDTARTALEIACRAPSVHNTQPWRWAIADRTIHLYADRSRQLAMLDPAGRELVISCGAALHHLRIGLRALGWRPIVHRLPNPADRDHLAAVEFAPLPRVDARALALVDASAERRTDRRPFQSFSVPSHVMERIAFAGNVEQVRVTVVTEPRRRRDVIVALREADSEQRGNPMYQAELAEWTKARFGSLDGVPSANIPDPGPFSRGMAGRDFGRGDLEIPPAVDDGALLCVLSTSTDAQGGWLRTGEALSAVLLSATRVGLATCPLSQTAEVTRARDLIRHAALDGHGEPHIAIRVGWPVTTPFPAAPTPRRPVDEVVDSLARLESRH